jgi:hypothetical protein
MAICPCFYLTDHAGTPLKLISGHSFGVSRKFIEIEYE